MRPITLEDLYQQYRNRPVVIRDAIMRTNSHPTIAHAVTRATLRVLTRLVCRAQKHDGLAPLDARIDHLAGEAECDEKTVRRAISALVELGWLAMPTESRNRWGVFATRQYHFTQRFCDLVHLPCPTGQEAQQRDSGTEMSTGVVYVDLSFKEDQRQIEKEKRETQNREIELTPELDQAAKEFCMNRSGVALLRGLAHRAGYVLDDIILVGREYLHQAKATKNRAHRYLEAMILRKADYAARAAQLRRTAQASLADQAEIDRFVTTHQGKVYESSDMRELIGVAADGKCAVHRLGGIDRSIPLLSAQDVRNLAERIQIGHLLERKARKVEEAAPATTGQSAVARQVLAAALQMVRSRRSGGWQAA
ncbi:hypothetical protein EGT07_23635 [Herbaspirillum sp. HC18]|nr:hypothetical protein EGT07_23635 [Herbaspirillum sp. HC18]